MRIRDKWRTDRPRSVEDQASAVAYIIWQIGLSYCKNLHQEEFEYDSDEQRVEVIREYLIYLCHATDRLAYDRLGENQRLEVLPRLVHQVARHYQRNTEEVLGPGNYQTDFIALANRRFASYSKGAFEEGLPGYSARRLLGNTIQEIMGMSQQNKWVVQQVIDIDAPEAAELLLKSARKLLVPLEQPVIPKAS